MSHIENQMQQYVNQLDQLKSKISELEKEKMEYENTQNERRTNPNVNLETTNNWLILMEPLKSYYSLVEKTNQMKINIVEQLNINLTTTQERLLYFNSIPNWPRRYPDVVEAERELEFVRNNLPGYVYDIQSVGFTSPVRLNNKTLTIPSKFMIDFIDGMHNMCKLFSEKISKMEENIASITSNLQDIRKI